MKKVLSNNITADAEQPYIKSSIQHYEEIGMEIGQNLAKTIIGAHVDNVNFFVLWGCKNSTVLPIATISAGAIYYNGEIYLVDAFTLNPVTDTVVGTITETFTADNPVQFTDGNSYNINAIRKIVWSDAAPGSGDVDFGDLVGWNNSYSEPYSAGKLDASSGSWTVPGAGDFNVDYFVEGKKVTVNFRISNGTLSSTPASARLVLPDGMKIKTGGPQYNSLGVYINPSDTPTTGPLRIEGNAGSSELLLSKLTGSHVANAGGFFVYGQIVFEID